jgi:hypothetical protein
MANRLFVDTWAWLVFANDRDPAFERLSTIPKTLRLCVSARKFVTYTARTRKKFSPV